MGSQRVGHDWMTFTFTLLSRYLCFLWIRCSSPYCPNRMTLWVTVLIMLFICFIWKFISLFFTVMGLHCCEGFSLVAVRRGYSLVVLCGILIAGASLVVEHGLYSRWASVVVAPGLNSYVVHGLSCSEAHGIFLDQGSNLCLLLWQVDSLPLSH